MPHMISVQPAESGWLVTTSTSDGPMFFDRGGDAEAAARRLGQELSTRGQPAHINVHLKDGRLAARLVCDPTPTGRPRSPAVIWPTQAQAVA
jgi:hypothetical protein